MRLRLRQQLTFEAIPNSSLNHPKQSFSVQCQLFTFRPCSPISFTFHRGSASSNFAMADGDSASSLGEVRDQRSEARCWRSEAGTSLTWFRLLEDSTRAYLSNMLGRGVDTYSQLKRPE